MIIWYMDSLLDLMGGYKGGYIGLVWLILIIVLRVFVGWFIIIIYKW